MGTLDRIRSDLRMVRLTGQLAPAALRYRPGKPLTLADRLDAVIAEQGDQVAILDADDGGREVTYREIGTHADRVAHWAIGQGLGRGDVVALLMMNRPEYAATWLGLARVGVITALINTNLTGEPLRHSVAVSGAGHLILDRELADQWATARDPDQPIVEWHTLDGEHETGETIHDLDADLAARAPTPIAASIREGMTTSDPLFFIYTSGTTGLPKAARFTHGRFLLVSGLSEMVGLRSDDRVYVTLPLYHTAGGVMALGGALLTGGSAVVTRKFSASRFWDHCHEYEPTMFQYIGELCRYLLNSPTHPHERDHSLRFCIGNGLRPDVWPDFQERFAIPRIIEFYGATEGTGSIINLDNKIGAIGRFRPGVAKALGMRLVEYDVEADEIRRDAEGRVIPVPPGEPGELISRITDISPFEGYSDAEATEKKILRDAFEEGDAYFRSGDLLRQDGDGYYYFVDRVGDTFRWKGENVSTAEVAAVVGAAPGVREANVYGVEVEGHDGRAGMASLVVDDDFDPVELAAHLTADLAGYARPLFLRLIPEVEVTGTFKHRKVDAVAEGFDPEVIEDPLLFLSGDDGYVPLTTELHERILTGEVRV